MFQFFYSGDVDFILVFCVICARVADRNVFLVIFLSPELVYSHKSSFEYVKLDVIFLLCTMFLDFIWTAFG